MKKGRFLKTIVLSILLSFMTSVVAPGINMSVEAASIKLNKTSVVGVSGETFTLKLTGNTKPVVWKSLNKNIATVNSKGKVKFGWKLGSTKIQAKVGNKTYTCKVKNISWYEYKSELNLNIGKSATLSIKGATGTVKWSSSNTRIATVNSKGKVTAKAGGNVNIIGSYKDMKFYCSVNVGIDEALSKKNMSIKYEQCDEYTVAIVTNNNPYPVSMNAKMVFYGNSGMSGSASDDNYCLESGKTAVLLFYNPDEKRPNSYNMTYSLSESYEEGYASYITEKHNNGVDGVVVELKNNGSKKLDFINVAVLMYDRNGNLISADYGYADCKSSGSIDYRTFSYPYDDDYEKIIPASSKVYINYAY